MATVTRLDGTPVTLISKCTCCKQAINSNNEGFFNHTLCGTCYESAGAENEHLDTNGEHNFNCVRQAQDCPMCRGVECMHEIQS